MVDEFLFILGRVSCGNDGDAIAAEGSANQIAGSRPESG
jgi:polysaccharide pyruvyl transferase WcaK-like protein